MGVECLRCVRVCPSDARTT
ncbi:hypothetical protein DBA20_05980 [Pandoraea capi]|nr:hypothetical protein [Pandoraea capi]